MKKISFALTMIIASAIAMPAFADDDDKLIVSDLDVREENDLARASIGEFFDDFLVMETEDTQQIKVFDDNKRVD